MPEANASDTPRLKPRKRVSGVVVPNAPTRLQRVVAWLIGTALKLLAATLRYRINGQRGPIGLPPQPLIFALWHNRLALCTKLYRSFGRPERPDDRLAALISASKDGALLAALLENHRMQPVRGSSSRRGAQALVELTSWAERGYDIAVTPDGPRGPCYIMQPGVMTLAQLTGMPILPCSYRLHWKIRLKSWDRFQIPLPFARCDVFTGDLIRVPRDASDEVRDGLRQQLQDALMAITHDD
jgi:lysophospholipid acyltransferase (LPLAT)-like uncharacterized protein